MRLLAFLTGAIHQFKEFCQSQAGYFMNPGMLDTDVPDSSRYRLQVICEPGTHRESSITLSDEHDD